MRFRTILATVAGFVVCESLGGVPTDTPFASDGQGNGRRWEFSVSAYTYLAQHGDDYTNPIITADRDWFPTIFSTAGPS
jgi:hypothetical protein